jgi:hypothetical protein
MAFALPNFNLQVNIYRHGNRPPSAPDLTVTGALLFPRSVAYYLCTFSEPGVQTVQCNLGMFLLLPKGTDIRSQNAPAGRDYAEVPAGSGRYYAVYMVDDVGKGYATEYRRAIVVMCAPFTFPLA